MIPALPHETAPRSPAPSADEAGPLRDARVWAQRAGLALGALAERDGDVVALDASGAVVLVVGVAELTAPALVAALGRAAAVRGADPAEQAAWHARGAEGVAQAWWVARSAGGAAVAATGASVPALLVLATTVASDVEAALPALAGSVLVHRVGKAAATDAAGSTDAAPARPTPKPGPPRSGAPKPGPGPVVVTAAAVVPDVAEAAPAPTSDGDVAVPEGTTREPAAKPGPPRRPRVEDESAHEKLEAVVALVGEASLVLAGADGGVSGRLLAGGTIVVDGDRYADPTSAASAALGRPVDDGWTAWRFGADGPFLGEALQEALAHPARPNRPHRRRAVRG